MTLNCLTVVNSPLRHYSALLTRKRLLGRQELNHPEKTNNCCAREAKYVCVLQLLARRPSKKQERLLARIQFREKRPSFSCQSATCCCAHCCAHWRCRALVLHSCTLSSPTKESSQMTTLSRYFTLGLPLLELF